MKIINVADIRAEFKRLLVNECYVVDKSGVNTLEIIACTFLADEISIFGSINEDYVRRELDWYNSQSLNVNDISGKIPEIWKVVSDKDGFINSNYGYLIHSTANNNQYQNVLNELRINKNSRRASMIYTRPSIWLDYSKNGMSDFICTHAVDYLIRNEKLHAHVIMRSNDAFYGYRNDRYWQAHVQKQLADELHVGVGNLLWTVSSLHVYSRHFELLSKS